MPPRAMLPASWNTWVPRERPMPSAAYASPPSARTIGTAPRVSTLLTDGRPAEQPLERRDRRLGAHLAALALEALEHRGLLAADVGAGARPARARSKRERRSRAPSRRATPCA